MNQTGADSGTEFVLDNRKLILTFLVLVAVCGAFFIIGFMEGKRQAVPTRIERASSDPAGGAGSAAVRPDTQSAGQPTAGKGIEDRSGSAQLEWYKNAQAKESVPQKQSAATQAVKSTPPARKPSVAQAQATKAAAAESRSMVPAANVTYTVQVGAFKQKQEAESRAAALKLKGYLCVIDFRSAEQLYLIKVGRFDTRADAKAVQLQLSKDGFSSFIKVN